MFHSWSLTDGLDKLFPVFTLSFFILIEGYLIPCWYTNQQETVSVYDNSNIQIYREVVVDHVKLQADNKMRHSGLRPWSYIQHSLGQTKLSKLKLQFHDNWILKQTNTKFGISLPNRPLESQCIKGNKESFPRVVSLLPLMHQVPTDVLGTEFWELQQKLINPHTVSYKITRIFPAIC